MTKHQQPIIIYDGVCILCSRYVQWLLTRDTQELFRYVALQDVDSPILQSYQRENDETVILLVGDKTYTHSDVGLHIFKSLGMPWSLLSVLLIIPKFIRDAVYRWIARNRYKWFGRPDTCFLPKPEKKHLFLEAI